MRGALRLQVLSWIGLLAASAVFVLPMVTEQETEAATKFGVHKARKARAVAHLSGCSDSSVRGRAYLVEEPSEEGVKVVRIAMKVRGLPDGKHGVHIHETASCDPCGSAGGHFDPGPMGLPSPDGNHPYHLGDLVNLEVKNGTGMLRVLTTRVTLSPGPLSLFDQDGSAFIVHIDEDTFCPDGVAAGCAGGGRAACGIIRKVR